MSNQIVIVTGGGRGIGFGIASCFAEQGASLVIADQDGEAAQRAAEECRGMGAADAIGIGCDVTDRGQVSAMVEAAWRRFGRIDVLVNNAGICPFVDFFELTPDIWQRTLDVNLTGAFHCTQLAGKKMVERGQGGRIIFITSLAENVSNENQVDYGASKAGLKMLMTGCAIKLARYGITCNAIAPGMIMTPMVEAHWSKPENQAFARERIPSGRLGTPRDIGQVAVFLASPEAEYINGVSIRVDGGHQTRAV